MLPAPMTDMGTSWSLDTSLLQRLTSSRTRGLLVVGQLMSPADVAAAAAIAEALGWPVAADVLSGAC